LPTEEQWADLGRRARGLTRDLATGALTPHQFARAMTRACRLCLHNLTPEEAEAVPQLNIGTQNTYGVVMAYALGVRSETQQDVAPWAQTAVAKEHHVDRMSEAAAMLEDAERERLRLELARYVP
jgi:hypothetical protein